MFFFLLDTKTGKLLLEPLAHAENLGAHGDIGTDTIFHISKKARSELDSEGIRVSRKVNYNAHCVQF